MERDEPREPGTGPECNQARGVRLSGAKKVAEEPGGGSERRRWQLLIIHGMKGDAQRHEFTPRPDRRSRLWCAGKGESVGGIEGDERLANVIDVTDPSDELAPRRAPLVRRWSRDGNIPYERTSH